MVLAAGIVGQAPQPRAEGPPAWGIVALVDQRKAIDDVLFSDDGKFLAAVSNDGAIVLWNAQTLQKTLRIENTQRSTTSLAFSIDGSRLASWSQYEPRVKIWETSTGKLVGEMGDSQGERGVEQVAFSGDGQTLAVMTLEIRKLVRGPITQNERTLRTVLWNLSTLQPLDTSFGPPGPIGGFAFSHDGKKLAVWHEAFLDVWDLSAEPPTSQSFAPHRGAIAAVAFGSDNKTATVVDRALYVTTWDVETRMQRAQSAVDPARGLSVVNFSVDGSVLALGGRDRNVTLWRASSLQPLGAPLAGHPETVAKIVFNADHRVLAAASPGYVRFWDLASQAVIGTCDVRAVMKQRADEPWRIAMSPDGRQLATVRSGDSKVVVCKAP
jgi:WD40 repeat protein